MNKYENFISTKSGLKYKILEEGDGNYPNDGDLVEVHYAGTFENGKEFDNSYKRGEPISFPIGTGSVIKGWDEGIKLLSTGAKAVLVIPPELGYGSKTIGPIPGNSTLLFKVELVKIK